MAGVPDKMANEWRYKQVRHLFLTAQKPASLFLKDRYIEVESTYKEERGEKNWTEQCCHY